MPKNTSTDSVSERRLRPIYDWLDNGNNKKALQEADKVLKKHPDFDCCLALKCLALMRLGRETEASTLLEKVLASSPVDEGALNAMTIAFRELQEPGKICRMYEGAVAKEPNNEEFLTHLFMSYVRMGEYKKQEEAARNLYKVKPKNPYFFWSVMSLVLQAIEGDPKLGQTVHLPLAQRKVAKMAADGKMEQEQEVLLYILVLELKGAWSEALEVLEGKLGAKLASSASYRTFYRTKRTEFLRKLGRWTEVAHLAAKEVEEQPDQWAAYTNYLGAIKRLTEEGGSGPSKSEAADLVKLQQEKHPALRGPWLAQLELLSTLGHSSDSEVTSLSLIIQYFDKFGSKHVAFSDLKPYVAQLGGSEQEDLVAQLRERCSGPPTSAAEIYRDINLRALQRFCGGHRELTEDVAEAEVANLVARWRLVQPLMSDFLATDLRPSDSYLVLAAHLLWDLWIATGSSKHFLRATTILQMGVTSSPSNWQMKLLLIRFYNSAGCGAASARLHTALDIKHLMLDSLGWLLPRALFASANFDLAADQINATVRLYNHVNKDTADHIITAYRSGTFYQIRDIYNLRSKIAQSHHYASIDTERVFLHLMTEVTAQAEAQTVFSEMNLHLKPEDEAWSRLKDNRDMSTMVTWDPKETKVPEDAVRESFSLEVMFARCRHLLLRCISAAVLVAEDPGNAPLLPSLENLLPPLSSHWKNCREHCASANECKLPRPQAPDTPRLLPYSQSEQIEVLTPLLQLIHSLTISQTESCQSLLAPLPSLLLSLGENISVKECGANLRARGSLMESLVFRVETLGLVALLLVAVAQIFGVGGNKTGKKGKKGKAAVNSTFAPLVAEVNLVQEAGVKVSDKLAASIQEFEDVLKEASLADSLELLSFTVEEGKLGEAVQEGEEGKEVISRMEQSYTASLQQLRAVLQRKRKHLESSRIPT